MHITFARVRRSSCGRRSSRCLAAMRCSRCRSSNSRNKKSIKPWGNFSQLYFEHRMSILVTGATGKIGEHLVKILVGKGVKPACFVRDTKKAAGIKELTGASFVPGDLHDVLAFGKACEGHERLFLLTNEQRNEKKLCEAAKAAGVKHIVRISCWLASSGAEQGSIFEMHGTVETELQNLGIAVTNLRPADFFQNALNSAGSIKGQGAHYSALNSDTRVASIDAYDIANTAASILTQPIANHAGMAYTLTGPQALTREEYVATISKVIGKPVNSIQVDDASLYKTYVSYKMGERYSYLLVNLAQQYRLQLSGNRGFITGNVEIITGQKPRTFEQWVTDAKAAFQ